MSRWNLQHNDCLDGLKEIASASVDSLVTDPPAGISLMGAEWDSDRGGRDAWAAWMASIMRECYRTLKPGAHALIWALPRTSHWTAKAVEDAGFVIRDVLTHIQAQGFPKSVDLGKQLPEWEGWGSALKPASEHWILARKPLAGTIVQNVAAHGTGALNIDATRIETTDDLNGGAYSPGERSALPGDTRSGPAAGMFARGAGKLPGQYAQPRGRWPANLMLSHSSTCADAACDGSCPVAELDLQSGIKRSGGHPKRRRADGLRSTYGEFRGGENQAIGARNTVGGASRFFFVSKPTTAERNAGGIVNDHPTVKPLQLMRQLCRLIAPPGGTVLDPFAGSGTTGIACVLEGFSFVGFEIDAKYVELARARISHYESEAAPGEA